MPADKPSRSMIDDLKKFQSSYDSENKFQAIQSICRTSRKMKEFFPDSLDSELITCALYHKFPQVSSKTQKVSSDCSRYDEVMSHVTDDRIIQSVNSSLKVSTPDSINFIYESSLDEFEMSRVRILTRMIICQDLV